MDELFETQLRVRPSDLILRIRLSGIALRVRRGVKLSRVDLAKGHYVPARSGMR